MKIGFDISQTGDAKAGCGFFAENMISHLANVDTRNDYLLYKTFGDHYWDPHYQKTYRIQSPRFHYGLHHSNMIAAKQFWRKPPANYDEALGSVDILHSNNFFCPPKLKQGKLIYTLYDLSFVEYPDCTTEHNRIACFDGVFKASLQADWIIAISKYSREHFLKLFPHYPKERVSVVYPASRFATTDTVRSPSVKLKHLVPEQFWLTVGTLEPRKNIRYLLHAYAKLVQKQKTFPLVLAGKQGWLINDLEKTLKSLNLEDHVHVLGYVDDEELKWLYQKCYYLIFPSLFEGFGLPVLEAMTLGAPVITSTSSSLPEVLGNAGILIDPKDEEDLLQTLIKVSDKPELRSYFKMRSNEQIKHFSWENSAKQLIGIYEQALQQPDWKRIK